MLDPNTLIAGEIYFICGYSDLRGEIPTIEVTQYVGRNCLANVGIEGNYFVFCDPKPGGQRQIARALEETGKRVTGLDLNSTEMVVPGDTLDGFFDVDGLIEFLEEFKRNQGDSP